MIDGVVRRCSWRNFARIANIWMRRDEVVGAAQCHAIRNVEFALEEVCSRGSKDGAGRSFLCGIDRPLKSGSVVGFSVTGGAEILHVQWQIAGVAVGRSGVSS